MTTTEKKFLPRVFLDIAQCPPEFFGNPDGKPEYGYTQGFEFKKTNANDKEYLSVAEHEAKMADVSSLASTIMARLKEARSTGDKDNRDTQLSKSITLLDEVLAMGEK